VCADNYYYTPPEVGCKWGMTVEKTSAFVHTKSKIWAFGSFYKSETYNHNGDLISASVYRPDYLGGARFNFNGFTTTVSSSGEYYWDYSDVIGMSSTEDFQFMDKTEWDGTECFVYYKRNETAKTRLDGTVVDIPDYNNAWYVDEDGFLLAKVENDNDWEKRVVTEYNYHGAVKVLPSDFTFSKRFAYACSDERVFSNPDMYYAQCTASTTSVILSVVVAALVASFVLVF